MGRLGRLLSYLYTTVGTDKAADIKYDPGGGANITAHHAEPANQTSRPLPQDLTVAIPVPGEGREVIVAFIDPNNLQDIAEGEHKTYARDAAGAVVCSVHLLATGAIEITNSSGAMTLGSSGTVSINGVTIDTSGNITAPSGAKIEADTVEGLTSLLGAGVEHVAHAHGGVTTGGQSTAPIV